MLAGYYKRKVDPWEAAAWSALAVDTLAGTWGTVGSKKGHQGNTLAQAAAAIARAVASHKSVQACHSPWGIVAARETADGETVEVPWQKGPEREARPQRGPEREAPPQRGPETEALQRRDPEAAVPWRRALEEAMPWRRVLEEAVQCRRDPEAAADPCTHPLRRAAQPRTAPQGKRPPVEAARPAAASAGRTVRLLRGA